MTDKRKNNKGQPKKPDEEKKVPLTFSVKKRNRDRIKTELADTVKKMDQ